MSAPPGAETMWARLVGVWERVWFEPGPPTGLRAARVIVAGQALWILLSRPDVPQFAAWPAPFRDGLDPWLLARFGALSLDPGSEQVLYGLAHLALLGVLLGLWPRVCSAVAGLLLYHFAPYEELLAGLPHTSFGGLTVPVISLFVLAFARTPAADAAPSWEHRWPLALIRASLALSYFFPFLGKLRYSGPLWFTADNLAQYATLNGVLTGAPWAPLVAHSPLLGWIAAAGTLCLEMLSPLLVVSSTFAMAFAAAAFAFHVGILMTLGYFFPSLPLLLLLLDWDRLGVWWQGRRGRRGSAADEEPGRSI